MTDSSISQAEPQRATTIESKAPAKAASSARRILLTGATGGIGQAIADQLASRGHQLILMGRRTDSLEAIQDRLGEAVEKIISVDFLQPHSVGKVVVPTLEGIEPIDVLINNAGAGIFSQFLDQSPEDHERMMRLNYLIPADMIRHVLPGMIDRGRGHIINIASMSSKVGPWGHAGYAAAKAALVSLTQTLSAEYAHRELHFTYLNPGIIDTPYFQQPAVAGLWEIVKKHAIPPERIGVAVAKVIDRPTLEVCVPAHFRMLDTIRAFSPGLAVRVVTDGSKPADAR